MTYQVEDNDDLEVSGRILDILRTTDLPEGCWDGAIDYILEGGEWS